MRGFIYKITNTINSKSYIGQTIKDLLIRHNVELRTTRTYKLSQKDRDKVEY